MTFTVYATVYCSEEIHKIIHYVSILCQPIQLCGMNLMNVLFTIDLQIVQDENPSTS